MSNIKSLTHILPLVIILLGLVSYNFMSAQWTPAPASPPGVNAAAPINVSGIYQAKLGDLGAVRMRAGEYCNAAGTSCFTEADVRAGLNITCASGQALRGISSSGAALCTSLSGGAPPANSSCSLDGVTVNNGNSRTFYNVTTSSSCSGAGLSRTCTNGILSGSTSYRYASCAATPPIPSGLGHTCESNGTQATVYWNPVTPNAGYNLRINGIDRNISNTWYTVNIVPGGNNSWSVQTKAASGPWSNMSNVRTFTCP